MAEPSLGEGIGLQQGANRDDYWAKQIYARGVEKKAAREKADEDLIKEADFKKDYSKFLPMYANKIAEIQQGVLQKVALARQANKNTARSVVAKDLYQAQLEVGKLEQDNARAMDYVKNDKITKEPTVIEALVNPNGQVSDLADFNDGQFFMTDATGTFAYRPYKEPDLASKVKYDGKYNKAGYPTGKYEIRGNQRYQELKSGYDQTAVNAEALQLAQTDDFRQKVAYDTRLWKPEPNETQDAFIKRKLEYADNLALETAAKMKGVDVYEMRPSTIPQPREQSDANKKVKPSIVPFDQKRFNEEFLTKTVKNKETGKDEKVKVDVLSQGESYSRMANMKPAKGVTIPVTDELIAINPELKGVDAISVNINNLVEGYNPKGKKEWYGIGIQSDYVEPEEGTLASLKAKQKGDVTAPKKRISYNPKIPLEFIRSALELAGNDLTEFKSPTYTNENKKSASPATPNKMVTVEIDGKVGEIPSDKLDAFKKKYPNAKIR